MHVTSNTFDLLESYKNYYQENGTPLSCVYKTQAALLYCIIPILGGSKPKGKRVTKNEMKEAMIFLESISLEQIINSAKFMKNFMDKENIPKNKQREYWTYFKKLLNWANEQQYIINKQSDFVSQPSKNLSLCTKGQTHVKDKNINVFSGTSVEEYSAECKLKNLTTSKLHKQLEDYRKFLIEERGLCKHKKSSVDVYIAITKLILNWLHAEKDIPVHNLCLELIVPLIEIKPRRAEYKNTNGIVNQKSYLKAKKEFERQATEYNEKTIALVKDFLKFHSKGLSIKINIIIAVTNIAKFLYKNDTNTKVARNFEDIEIIELLRKLRREEINNFKMARKSKVTRLKVNTKVLGE